jgi:hypothetical protein
VDHSKLDARLSAALEDVAAATAPAPSGPSARAQGEPGLSVFVQLDPHLSDEEQAKLADLGLPMGSAAGGIATATLSPDQVRQLSEEPSVRQLRLSTPLRLLGSD